MSKTKSRRLFLPLCLATGVLAAGGTGAYFYFDRATLSDHAQRSLDEGFDSVQNQPEEPAHVNDTLDGLAAAMERGAEPTTTQPLPPVQPLPDFTSLPALPPGDRYESVEESEPLAAESPKTLAEGAAPTSNEAPAPMNDEPHTAETLVARGQSPIGALPAAEPLPSANPLRSGGATMPLADAEPLSDQAAEAAFGSAAPMAAAQPPEGYRSMPAPVSQLPTPEPMMDATASSANPLRTAQSAGGPESPYAAPKAMESESYAGGQPFAENGLASETPDARAHASTYAEPTAMRPAQMASLDAKPVGGSPNFDPRPTTGRGGMASMDQGTGRPGERALEGPQRPSLVLQKFAPAEIQVGKECQFVIKVRNVGQRPADDVVVADEVPQGTRFVAASPQPETSGGSLNWQLGTLSPGEERTLEVQLMPTEEGEIGSVAEVTFTAHASAKARCTRPQLALRMTAPAEVMIGRQQSITIEIHNPGTGDATGVMLMENVPENVRHQAGPALEFEIGTLRAGETRRLELVLTAEKAGRVVNLLTARADGNLQVQQEVEFDVISPALAVDVDGPSRRYLERPATYTVSVQNPGTAPAKDVQLVTKLPKGLQFVRANNLGEYDSATHSVYWSLAELPVGQGGSVELVAMPVQSGDHTIEVEGRAREGLEDRTSQPVKVEGLAAIMFEVHDAQDPIEVGGTTSYEIRVVNQGSKAASNVQVRALLPPGLAVTNVQAETRHQVEADGVVFEPLGRLAPKAEAVFRVDVQGVRPGDQRLLVEVRTDEIEQPIRKEESTRVFGDE